MAYIEQILAGYPRSRKPLTKAHEAIYSKEYKLNRSGGTCFSNASQKLEGWMHRRIATAARSGSILEIGAGTLNHLPYEPFEKIAAYDVIEPFTQLYADSPHKMRVRRFFADISEVETKCLYDRVLSVAVLEHLTDLPLVVAKSGVCLKEGGLFQHGIPSEGGMAWGLAWRLTTGLSFRLRTGLSYKTLMHHEHVNTAKDILAVARHFFVKVAIDHFPLPLHHGSFYTYLCASEPDKKRCEAYLKQRGH